MRAALLRFFAAILAVVAMALPATAAAQEPRLFTPQQLDQLLAPVALYPDPLLGQILMAATYPLEVVEASRWLDDPYHAGLQGDQLAVELEPEDWDPSVKSLVPFPQILRMMDSQLGWTEQLGDAFLAQPGDVMDSVQRLRAQARAAGTLYSTPEAVVGVDGALTTIEPADPQLIYVPVYDPWTVYGGWLYPDYPPFFFPPFPGYVVVGGRISFGFSISIVFPLWGWVDCDWHRHRIHIDRDRFNTINHYIVVREGRTPVTSTTWQHDPFHRRGIAYRDDRTRQRYLGHPAGAPETRRAYRGFDGRSGIAPRTVVPSPSAPSGVAPSMTRQPTIRPDVTAPRPPGDQSRDRSRERRFATPPTPSPAPSPAPAPPSGRTFTPREPRAVPVQPSAPRPSPAFGEIDRGRDVRRDAERGRASRESAPAPVFRQQPAPSPRVETPRIERPHVEAPRGNVGGSGGRAIRRDR